MPIINRILKDNPEKHEAFVYMYKKLNANPGEKQFYCGFHKGDPGDNYSHTSTDDDLDLDISKHNFEHEILHWGTMDEMRTKEYSILKSANARKNPEWYNKTIGAEGKSVKEIDLLSLSQMADDIKENNSYKGIQPIIKVFEKKYLRSEIKKLYTRLQVRFEDQISSNSKQISSWLDKKNVLGSIKTLYEKEKINLIVVVLEGITIIENGVVKVVDLIVGGNHTLDGTFASKHGKEIQFLIIPKDKHGLDYNSAKQLGSFLNKPDKQPGETSSEQSIIKQLVTLCEDYGHDSKSEAVLECLDLNECDPAKKTRLKKKLAILLKKNRLSNTLWKSYDNDDGRAEIEAVKNQLKLKYPNSRIFTSSSGYCEPGKSLIVMHKEIEGGMYYDKIIWILHHPTPEAEQTWTADYLPNNKKFVEMVCEAMTTKFSKIKNMDHLFFPMPTMKSDLN